MQLKTMHSAIRMLTTTSHSNNLNHRMNMKNILKYICVALLALTAVSCIYDDSELNNRLDEVQNRIEALKTKVEGLNSQLEGLSTITSGNVITSVTVGDDGNYVITYKDHEDKEQAVVIATAAQMVNAPLVGVQKEADGLYYWNVTVNGKTELLKGLDGKKIPVTGYVPVVSVDPQGFWVVGDQRINDENGSPIEAHDGESCVFKNIALDENGDLAIELGNGDKITVPVQNVFNLVLDAQVNEVVANPAAGMKIGYTVSGQNAADAVVAVAEEEGLTATIDRAAKQIAVTFPEGFEAGSMIIVGYDLAGHTVLRPVFFEAVKSDILKISTADQLVQFAKDVNAQNGAEFKKVVLVNDIDMSAVTTWIPIGNGTFNAVTGGADHNSTYNGAAFKGNFDGQNHMIKNLKMEAALSGDGQVFGLFGILDQAKVSNLKLEGGHLTASGQGTTFVGTIAGVTYGATVENCVNNMPIQFNGNNTDNVITAVGMVGFVYGGLDDMPGSVLRGLENRAVVTAKAGKSTKTGATAVQVGAIAGFADGASKFTPQNLIENCVNNGELISSCGRCSGIVAAANMKTILRNCVNNGNHTSDFPDARIGNLTCTMGSATEMYDCTNNGDVIMKTTSKAGQVAGMIALLNHDSVIVSGGGNTGKIIYPEAQTKYRGLLVANFSKFKSFDNVTVGGSLGKYNGGTYQMEEITESNYTPFLGYCSAANLVKVTNLVYAIK